MDSLLRGLGVARSVLGVVGRYRAAQLVGLAVAVGWFLYSLLGGQFLAGTVDPDVIPHPAGVVLRLAGADSHGDGHGRAADDDGRGGATARSTHGGGHRRGPDDRAAGHG